MRRTLAAVITLTSAAALVSGVTVAAEASQSGHASRVSHASKAADASHTSKAGPARVSSASRQATGRAAPQVAHEHFRIISTRAGSHHQSVLARGQFTAGGYRVPGKVVNLRSTDKMVFPRGTFRVFRRITRQWLPLPTAACLIRETIHGRYSLGQGTGAYTGISGSGSFALRIRGVIRRSHGKCGGRMTVFQQITYAGGRISR
jgi:hypothetical protein